MKQLAHTGRVAATVKRERAARYPKTARGSQPLPRQGEGTGTFAKLLAAQSSFSAVPLSHFETFINSPERKT